ncbi:Polyadenylate-binding protein 1-B-binding protein [Quillaja saponaria]|uniref:Polyadenylate-binding protein 1-B-binding protein n=1 Tax=Quillaja saponaria TaxID=32244 RepID=A0AAD7QDW9_QUISA|nr:Polyadenylate-binding protein 1-B-binding protein [Quillaja saponaria]
MEFVGILRESQQIFIKHKKLMAFITLFSLLLHSILLLCNFFSVKPFLNDFIMKETLLLANPSGSDYASLLVALGLDIKIFTGVQWLFILATYIASLLSSTMTIIASANTYGGLNLTLKDLLSRAVNLWRRPLVTWFYMTLFEIGYLFLAILIFLPLRLSFSPHSHSSILAALSLILVSVFYMYLAVVWNLALVVSVLEEKYGFEAIGKAGQLVKGMKLNGMFSLMAFTIFYHICKKVHGEEIELQVSLELYSKLNSPAPIMISAELP